MFPLQRCNELSIPLSNSLNHHPHHKIPEDLILDDCDSLVFDFSHKKMSVSRPPKILLYTPPDHNNTNLNSIKDNNKKMVHREIEKQRRQEMATLHASLRSLLPLRFIKVKYYIIFIFQIFSSLVLRKKIDIFWSHISTNIYVLG
jgi:hypothetical protein